MKPEEEPPPLPAWIFVLFVSLMLANSYFVVWTYDELVTKQQHMAAWAMVNLLFGYASWLLIYRGMFDGQKAARLVRAARAVQNDKKKE